MRRRIERGFHVAAPAAASVALSVGGLYFIVGTFTQPIEQITWVLGTLAVAGLLFTLQVWRGRTVPPDPDRAERLVALMIGPMLAIAGASGGVRSPAVLLVALGTAAAVRGRGFFGATIRGAAVFGAIMFAHAVLVGTPDITSIVWAGAIVLGLAVFPEWQRDRSAVEIARMERRTERLEGWLGVHRTTPTGSFAVPRTSDRSSGETTSRKELTLARLRDDERREHEVLNTFLRDARDVIGADELIYWRYTPDRDALRPVAFSGDGAEPEQFEAQRWDPLLEWTAKEIVVNFDDAARPRFAAAAVGTGPESLGALSASSHAGFSMKQAELKLWLPRFAAHVAQLSDLVETQQEYRRQTRQTQALLNAAQHFQSNRSTDSLGGAICEAALNVTSAQRACLVRWNADENKGEVQSTCGANPVLAGTLVSEDSHVGRMCQSGLPQVWEDATSLSRDTPVYGPSEPPRTLGSLAVVPLKRELGVIGAIVIEGDAPKDVLVKDSRNVRLLAAVAAVSLETVWEIEEVTRRARTDQLTGLANRRHFDEQLGRLLGEADRYGHPVSLIMADIDYFKKVNDTYGHDAGDLVLKRVASTLQEGVRTVDICARFGGEEIALLLPQTDLAGATDVAERLRAAIERRVTNYKGAEIRVTASFGVSTYGESVRSRDTFFLSADRSLYQAKAEGRNKVKSAATTPYPESG